MRSCDLPTYMYMHTQYKQEIENMQKHLGSFNLINKYKQQKADRVLFETRKLSETLRKYQCLVFPIPSERKTADMKKKSELGRNFYQTFLNEKFNNKNSIEGYLWVCQ